jgi:hypothetical protein
VFCSEIVIRCRICVGCSELAFAAETELFAANYHSLPNWVFSSEIVICCRSCVGYSELTFAAETELFETN